MKLAIYLTVCMFTTVHCVPDQTWNAITKVEDRVDKLEKNNNYKHVEDRVNGIQRSNDEMKQNNDEMEIRLNQMAARMQAMEQEIDELQSENSELRNQIQELGAEASSSAVISFSAKMTSGFFVPGGDNIIPFDEAITNPGGHYREMTYKFTCPVEGLYFFTFSLFSSYLQVGNDHDRCAGRLVMDGAMVVEAQGRTYDNNLLDEKQVSTSAVVLCSEGAQVYVIAPYPDTGIYGDSFGQTTFSGFIL